ncbi:MAG: sigma-54 dependent transcriptional regulator [Smithellaceae bacterium]|nr:sigma-54 dependent transcriptional regulator [Smithellaceae bacterium]
MYRILIADDELNMRLVLEAMLRREGYEVTLAADGREAWQIIRAGGIDTVITDLKMPHLDGLALLDQVTRHNPGLPVIIISAYGTVAGAVDAVKRGAFDYITKPFEQDEIKAVLRKAVASRQLDDKEYLPEEGEIDRQGIIGTSQAIQEVYENIKRVAPTTTTVLITGETGTGKELVAKAIHMNSPRRTNPFIKINCAAIPENLIESELFGYEKGAFTGAQLRKQGKFEIAHRGTIFLDEIGEIPKDMQVKILRLIQEQEFERIGGLKTIKVEVRLVAATNRDLFEEVKKGNFREDLYYRLNIFPIQLPPLRERREDVDLLADHFLNRFNEKLSRNIQGIEPAAREALRNYPWPGNIRELENLLERMVLVATGETISRDDLPGEIKTEKTAATPKFKAEGQFNVLLKGHMEEVERQTLIQMLDEEGGNVTRTAKRLGISRKGLQMKMIKYDLRRQE